MLILTPQRSSQGVGNIWTSAVSIDSASRTAVGLFAESDAQVARMLKAPAAIVAEAGVGRPIDEIVLNRALFARHGVEVVGAIIKLAEQAAKDPWDLKVSDNSAMKAEIKKLVKHPKRKF